MVIDQKGNFLIFDFALLHMVSTPGVKVYYCEQRDISCLEDRVIAVSRISTVTRIGENIGVLHCILISIKGVIEQEH